MSAHPGSSLGAAYRRLFFGQLGDDFRLVGRFAEIFTLDPRGNTYGFNIPMEGPVVYTLDTSGALHGPNRQSDEDGTFRTITLTRVTESTALP